MSEWSQVVGAFILGLFNGVIFYGGLWWTVRRTCAGGTALWLPGSLLLRTAITLAGFYPVTRGRWYDAVAWLLGFVVARIVVTFMTRSAAAMAARDIAHTHPDTAVAGSPSGAESIG